MHGKGVMTWPDGRKYDGDFFMNMMQGSGVYHWPNGRIYEGEFYNNKQHGTGIFNNGRGIQKAGQWSEGVRTEWLNEREYYRL